MSTSASRLQWFWDNPPAEGVDGVRFAARITGNVIVPTTGDWEIGVRAVGPVSVWLDGMRVIELAEAQTGGSFFAMGSPEIRATVAMEEGRRHELVVELGAVDGGLVRGLAVGAAPVPVGDPIARAVAVAAAADVAVVIVGTDDDWETEGEDRASLSLPGNQDALVAAVAAANPRTIVVINTGSPGHDAVARCRPGRLAVVVPRSVDRRRVGRCDRRRRRARGSSPDDLPAADRGHARRSITIPGRRARRPTASGCTSGTSGTTAMTSRRCSPSVTA